MATGETKWDRANDRKRTDKDTRGPGRTDRNEDSLVIRRSMVVPMSDKYNHKYNYIQSTSTSCYKGCHITFTVLSGALAPPCHGISLYTPTDHKITAQ
jgi:hypothetical protein